MDRDLGRRTAWQVARLSAKKFQTSRGSDLSVRANQFRNNEDGSTTVLTFFLFIFMLFMAGIGIDMMRYEMERTHLQATLDAAVLAGASAPTEKTSDEIKNIVEDYFVKTGMSDYLNEIQEDDIVTTLNQNAIYATAEMEMDTYLMKMSGVDTLGAFGAAAAEMSIPKLEVSLVLDVSGSMQGTKLANLQAAAKSFVTTIFDNSEEGDTVISLVPFAWNVTPSEEIYNALTVNETHDYSTCIRFDSSDYSDTDIDPSAAYEQQIFTAVYGDFDDHSDGWRSCFPEDRAEILPYSMSETDLHTHIDNLDADGNTSAHIGMKWGAALLDPAFDSVFTSLQGAGVVDTSLANIPAVYGESQTLKVVVLMADGKNTTSYYFDETSDFRGANSDLYLMTYQDMEFQYAYKEKKKGGLKYSYNESKCSNSKWTCVYEASGDVVSAYYLRDGSDYYDIEEEEWISSSEFNDIADYPGFISQERLSWEEAWGFMSPNYYGDITGNWDAWDDYVGSEYANTSTKDTQMQAICSATKAENVVVYTIGYDISSGGNAETQLLACASSGNHYYPTDGDNIAAAFNSIASNVRNLRLTQ